jgi:hypothetical protein
MPGQSSTRLVINDADRSLAAVWSDEAGLAAPVPPAEVAVYSLTGPGGTVSVDRIALPSSSEGWKDQHHGAFRIPNGLAPGLYTLDTGGPTFAFAAVAAPARRNLQSFGAGAPADAVTRAFAAGHDVRLAAGDYEWAEPATVPYSPRTVYARGAHVRGGGVAPGASQKSLFYGGRDLTLDGGTYEPDDDGFVCHTPTPTGGNDAGRGFVFKRLKVIGGAGLMNLFTSVEEVLVRDVEFHKAANLAPAAGLWLRPTFTGKGPNDAFRRASTTAGTMAIIDPTFVRTRRGLVFQTTGTPVTHNLIVGLTCVGVDHGNGSEILLAEGAGVFDHNIVFTTRGFACTGLFPNFDCPANNNLFQDGYLDSPAGAILWGSTGKPQTGNVFDGIRWKGPVVLLGEAATNHLVGCAIRYPGPLPANQTSTDVSYYDDAATACIAAAGPNAGSHTATDCRLFPGTGIDPVQGAVVLSGCRVHGELMDDGPWSGP